MKSLVRSLTVIAAAAAVLLLASPAQARIARLVIERTESLGSEGYEKVTGHAYGELDPKIAVNAIITDLEFAPRNARGMVEYIATFTIVKPADLSKASGVLPALFWRSTLAPLPSRKDTQVRSRSRTR